MFPFIYTKLFLLRNFNIKSFQRKYRKTECLISLSYVHYIHWSSNIIGPIDNIYDLTFYSKFQTHSSSNLPINTFRKDYREKRRVDEWNLRTNRLFRSFHLRLCLNMGHRFFFFFFTSAPHETFHLTPFGLFWDSSDEFLVR